MGTWPRLLPSAFAALYPAVVLSLVIVVRSLPVIVRHRDRDGTGRAVSRSVRARDAHRIDAVLSVTRPLGPEPDGEPGDPEIVRVDPLVARDRRDRAGHSRVAVVVRGHADCHPDHAAVRRPEDSGRRRDA